MDRNEVIAKLKAVEPQLRGHGVAALYLFGSYARDEARQDSDVDVFVDPGTQDFYSLSHFVGAYEVICQAVPGRENRLRDARRLVQVHSAGGRRGGGSNLLMAATKSPLMRLATFGTKSPISCRCLRGSITLRSRQATRR